MTGTNDWTSIGYKDGYFNVHNRNWFSAIDEKGYREGWKAGQAIWKEKQLEALLKNEIV